MIKPILAAAAALAVLPIAVNAQDINVQPGFYVGAGGGLVVPLSSSTAGGNVGWAVGGQVGYDFVGPRISLDVGYGQLPLNFNLPGTALNGKAGQLTGLINLYYDFFPASTITPYIGAGAGIAFIDSNSSLGSTQFAWDALLGVRYNVDNALGLNLEARYVGTTNPTVNFNGQTFTGQNQNIVFLAGVTYKFNQPRRAATAAAAAGGRSVVHGVLRLGPLEPVGQALNTIRQAAGAYKTKGSARITATGHTDTSGPEAYNMALSLRRANTVKDALVREGVPATAIAVIGRGEQGLLVQTADGVREPQNRRVEIVIQ